MTNTDSHVTIHMVASLDGFIARKDGSVDWLETSDEFVGGDTMDPGFVEAFLKTIDCYVMGSRTYETALSFEAKGFGWPYGDKPTFVLTRRELPRTRDTVELYSGDLAQLVNGRLRPLPRKHLPRNCSGVEVSSGTRTAKRIALATAASPIAMAEACAPRGATHVSANRKSCRSLGR
jgi:hypothetical protein